MFSAPQSQQQIHRCLSHPKASERFARAAFFAVAFLVVPPLLALAPPAPAGFFPRAAPLRSACLHRSRVRFYAGAVFSLSGPQFVMHCLIFKYRHLFRFSTFFLSADWNGKYIVLPASFCALWLQKHSFARSSRHSLLLFSPPGSRIRTAAACARSELIPYSP